ncbi:WG repeat-containing protein [candidate division KSB1 bacterium]|nr:WG repeat-containing protein [candidate division KSB1 bacterium]
MISFLNFIVSLAEWLFKTSLKATVLIALILIVQLLFRRKMSARWQYALWLLLIIRLILPFEIESRISLFNLVPAKNVSSLSMPRSTERISAPDIVPANLNVPPISSQVEYEVATDQHSFHLSAEKIVALIWLLGVVAISCYAFRCNFKLWRKIRLQSTSSTPLLFQLLQHSIRQMKITRPITLIEMEGIQIPVLYGIFKPKILLPKNFDKQLTSDQIRHIFLHELAHYKRKDVLVSCLTTILQIVYWFNPIIWFAFYKMRIDRELACDEMTLNQIGAAQSQSYGQTIISVLENISIEFRLPIAVGIIENKKHLRRRLTMIANFKKRPFIWSIVAFIILLAVAGFALTEAGVNSQQVNSPDPQLSNFSNDESQNIDSLQHQDFDQRVEQEINSSPDQTGASENPQQNVSEKSTQNDKIQKPYRSEIIINFTLEGVKVDGDMIAVDSLANYLNKYRFDDRSIITLKTDKNAVIDGWFKVQLQIQSMPVKNIKYVNNKTGREVITNNYPYEFFSMNRFTLRPKNLNGKYGYVNRQGEVVIEAKFEMAWQFDENLAGAKIAGKWGFIDSTGNFVIEPQFDQITSFKDGLTVVKSHDKWGFIDKSGTIVIEPAFEFATRFHEGLALVTFNGKRGFIKKDGQFAIPATYENARELSEGLAAVKVNENWGFIDYNGNSVIDYKFDEVDRFSDGLALVRLNGKYGYINQKGNFVIKPQFDHAESFSEGLAAVRINGKYGFINKSGEIVIEPQYDHASDFMGGIAHVTIFEKPELNIEGQGFEIDKAGNVIGKE